MKTYWRDLLLLIFAGCAFVTTANAQLRRELSVGRGGTVEVINRYGRVVVTTIPEEASESGQVPAISATGKHDVADGELTITAAQGVTRVEVKPNNRNDRIDVALTIPARTRIKVKTTDGEVSVSGDLESVAATTETGTISADVPTDDIRYEMLWTESRPRFLSDFELDKVKERSGGKFTIKGRYQGPKDTAEPRIPGESAPEGNGEAADPKAAERADQIARKARSVSLDLTTARGIVLVNVPPNEVMSDLRERPLTEAAKAIIRSGDTLLMDSIRRASPKHFGDFTRTLPPFRREPGLTVVPSAGELRTASTKTASVRVTDMRNRAVPGLSKEDFEATESGEPREVLSARPTTSPVNLVLLVDVSGSVDNYVNFIRKAARAFIETVDPRDRVSIIIFNDDVKELATFSTDKRKLSESLDTFDAGGGTAYYDALGYTLTATLRSLKGERTAVVVLSDGDDNRSFLPFDSLAGTIEESGALIYPLYVPTSLVAAAASNPETAVDPLRSRYLSSDITSKADAEGKRLAEISGGVYYPITQLSQIQAAYDDIVVQLRTSYDVTFRSQLSTPDGRPSPRLKIRSTRPDTFVLVRSVRQHRTAGN